LQPLTTWVSIFGFDENENLTTLKGIKKGTVGVKNQVFEI